MHLLADTEPDRLKSLIANALLLSPVANTPPGPVALDVALAEAALPAA